MNILRLQNLILICLFLTTQVYCQYGVKAGDNIFRAGLGAGLADLPSTVPPILRIEYENFVNDITSVGLNVAAIFTIQTDGIEGWGISPKINFHLYSDLVFDFYIGIQGGAASSSRVDIILGGQIGTNIFLNRNFALFIEGGYGISFLTAGVTYRLPSYF